MNLNLHTVDLHSTLLIEQNINVVINGKLFFELKDK